MHSSCLYYFLCCPFIGTSHHFYLVLISVADYTSAMDAKDDHTHDVASETKQDGVVVSGPRFQTCHPVSRVDWINLSNPTFVAVDGSPVLIVPVDPVPDHGDHVQGSHTHLCPDGQFDTFPYGPLMRDHGLCDELIPMSCALCERISYRHCKNVYRVALTGADWDGFRAPGIRHVETGVLDECDHCGAPGDFHIHLAMFKGYYTEVLDLVRTGLLSLYDVRHSANIVAEWPPVTDKPLYRIVAQACIQVTNTLSDSDLPIECAHIVLEYWQGARPDFFSSNSSFKLTYNEMYQCNHGWPCKSDDGVRQHCKWLLWAQEWIHELMLCDGRTAIPRYHGTHRLPSTWGAWVDRREPEWRPRDMQVESEPIMAANPRDGKWRVQRIANLPGSRPVGLFKPESRMSGAWYTLEYCTLLSFTHTGTA